MLTGMLVTTATTAFASPPPSGGEAAFWDGTTNCFFRFGPNESDFAFVDGPFADGAQEVYFPAVGNDDDFGLGPADTSITVQNIDIDDAYIFIFVDGLGFVDYAYLSAGASKTFTADALGIEEGTVVPVWVMGFNELYESTVPDPDDPDAEITICNLDPAFMAGVAKQAVDGEDLPYTTSADTSVSGYNAISGRELGFFDQLYFPIVQTNCGPGGCWDTILRIANFGIDRNAAVTVRFFPADDGSGSLATGFQLQALVNAGDVWSIDLADWVPPGWVGSAHVYTDDAVAAIADRFKVGTDMWITNTASNAQSESFWQFPGGPSNAPFVLFAPDVRTDWNGWNTGINVANTVDFDNHVWIQYFGSNGNAPLALDRLLHAQGMTYFYNPSQPSEDECEQPATDVPGCEFIGGAIILSEEPVAVAVDGVKYFGNDANVGQAFTYAATSNGYTSLAAPLVQKGNPATGMGATSGINFLNPNAAATVITTTWINPSGFAASNFADSIVWVPGFSTGFVYTMFHANLPNGFYGSALVDSDLPVFATTANVDYQVQGDGTVVWNLYNPCGFFRFSGYPGDDPDCVYQSPLEPLPASATITKVVECPTCDLDFDFDPAITDPDEDVAVEGALVTWSGVDDNGFGHNGSGLTSSDGEVVFAVPPGTYEIVITGLPDGYAIGTDEPDVVTVGEGEAVTVYNEVVQAALEGTGLLTKALDVSGFDIGDPGDPFHLLSEIIFCNAVDLAAADADLDGVITPDEVEASGLCDSIFDDAAEAHGGFDDFFNILTFTFEFNAEVPAGVHYICWSAVVEGDFDGDPLTPDTSLAAPPTAPADVICEGPFYVFPDEETFVYNDFLAFVEGTLDVQITTAAGVAPGTPIPGIEVCVYEFDPDAVDDQGTLIACGITDADGEVGFVVPGGTYVVAAHGSLGDGGAPPTFYEDQAAVVDYNPAVDASDGFVDDDLGVDDPPIVGDTGTADAAMALDVVP
jgi:hypothetical protein